MPVPRNFRPVRIVGTLMRTRRLAHLLALFGLSASAAACARRPLYIGPEPEGTAPGHSPGSAESSADVQYLQERHLVVPVAGADMTRVRDSFDSGRSGGRVHHALDILAPRGTPVLAADDGLVLRLSSNRLGGITIYEVDSDGRMVYYYAHLDHYREPLSAGMRLVKGDTIGFVGTTGDAPKDTPHLHFQIMRMPADRKYWAGEPIDPWPILEEEAARADTADHRPAQQESRAP